MPTHTPEAVISELATIKKTIKHEGVGNNCLPADFAKIHYVAKLASDNKVVADTNKMITNGHSTPKLMVIGNFDQIKCFDLILP